MGRTILSATQTWYEEEKALGRFIRALRKSDQDLALELLALSRQHIAEASYASNLYPMDIYLVSMLLEMFKKVKQLEKKLEKYGFEVSPPRMPGSEIPALPSLVELVNPETPHKAADSGKKDASGKKYVDFQEVA